MASTRAREKQPNGAAHRSRRSRLRAWLKAVLIGAALVLLAIAGLLAGQINVEVIN